MSSRGKRLALLATKTTKVEDLNQDIYKNNIQEELDFSNQEGPGFIEVPLECLLQKTSDFPNEISTTYSRSNQNMISHGVDLLQKTSSSNVIMVEDCNPTSSEILSMPNQLYQSRNISLKLPLAPKENSLNNKNKTLTCDAEDSTKSYANLDNLVKNDNGINNPQKGNIFSAQESTDGSIVSLKHFCQSTTNDESSSSTSFCSDTTKSNNLSDGLSPLRKSPSPNIIEDDLSFKSKEILPIPKLAYQSESYSSDLAQSPEASTSYDVLSSSKAKELLVVKKKLFLDNPKKSYTNSGNPGESQPSVTNSHAAQEPVIGVNTIVKKVDKVLHNFGKIVEEKSSSNLEKIENYRRWTKKSCCPYCHNEVTHFPRHLQRNHHNEGAVREILELTKKDPKRKILLDGLRRQGNYMLNSNLEKVRPVRRPRTEQSIENYLPCNFCLGFFKKEFIRRHKKCCKMNKKPGTGRGNHLSESQAFQICSGQNKDFYDALRLKSEVLNKMRVDEISKTVMKDILICSYGESQLKRHKRVQLATMVSNKMRELGRLLIVLRESTGIKNLIDALKPEFYDHILTATKIISGYNEEEKNFESPSLALHMSTRLTQVCDIATKLIIKKCRFIECGDPEEALKNVKRLKSLISNHFNSEISSLALKDLNEKQWEKPKMFPLTSELQHFQKYALDEAKKACEYIKGNKDIHVNFRKLTEIVMALTLLINRKRIGEVQFLKLNAYTKHVDTKNAEEFIESFTKSENMLTKNFKRVVTGGKGSKPVAILFPKKIQAFIDVLLSVRSKCVSSSNEYLFPNPKNTNRWLSGYHTIKKLANLSGVSNPSLFTSTRLRKQIATVLQVMNVSETEMEQFANFMGHTKKTHEEYYRLPQDLFQTAKVSKLLIAINKGQGAKYKGKSLDEINLSDLESDDSDHEFEENPNIGHKLTPLKIKHDLNKSTHDSPSCSTKPSPKNKRKASKKMESEAENYSESNSSGEDSFTPPTKKKKPSQRQSWSKQQIEVVRKFFSQHIDKKLAPKKHEVEELQKKYPVLFKTRNWVNIKAYVYNCFKNK